MSEFKENDLVEAVKGETMIRGRLNQTFSGGKDFWVGDSTRLLSGLPGCGWVVSLVEAAPEPLPAEAGHYQDQQGRHWLHQIYDGSSYGAPDRDVDQWIDYKGEIDDPASMIDVLPLTRLEPVPETAKRVIDAVRTFAWADGFTNQLDRLEKEFGVTS